MNNGTVLDCQAWGGLYKKFRTRLVNSLSSSYCRADREDAVEFAFDKLMHRKDAVAYGDRFPRTEKDWFWNLYWQSRSFLSHMKHRSGLHAKYVESMSKEFEGTFDSGLQGVDMDAETCSEALARALEIFRVEQGISRRDLNVFVLRQRFQTPSKEIAVRYGITVSNVDVIRHRVGKLLRKHGPDCYARALGRAA
ncbi:MAG: sigma-70 family RNA polymerase sigma factor [Kiritimatiellae bacterium]|nr:sigma-70 family RNA polymerase sigma factor [Kiritimatiellia bacterium]